MTADLADFARALAGTESIAVRVDLAAARLLELGFDSMCYDYTPVPLSHDGRVIAPNLVEPRNVPASFLSLWVEGGYAEIDPVQALAVRSAMPFVWSVAEGSGSALRQVLAPDHAPVVHYLRDTRMSCGITVPMHLPGGDFATFTGVRIDPEAKFERDAEHYLGEIALIGALLHASIYPALDRGMLSCRHVRLTRRERECLQWSARGLTTKEIAGQIARSPATVTLHLENATRKLGARNRAQAVARAAHYRILESAC
jgi:LuxR family transcriptional regulator, quorum-sensing system regulator SdiA